ncbi:MAG: GIY-YIG nuclease family protein [Balneolaceae bacterium]|nr:GIY-YIG nuclease family protein [Balneolaceae bacterium]
MGYHNRIGKNGYVYILSNCKRNMFYIGVTNDLEYRILQHKEGKGSAFTKRYKLKYLVYFEEYPNIKEAISREKQLKNWHHNWKRNLIKESNPSLKDLAKKYLK